MFIVNRNFDFYDCLDFVMVLGNFFMLCGKGSKDIKAEMEVGFFCNNKERLVKLCFKFFSVRNKLVLMFLMDYFFVIDCIYV